MITSHIKYTYFIALILHITDCDIFLNLNFLRHKNYFFHALNMCHLITSDKLPRRFRKVTHIMSFMMLRIQICSSCVKAWSLQNGLLKAAVLDLFSVAVID